MEYAQGRSFRCPKVPPICETTICWPIPEPLMVWSTCSSASVWSLVPVPKGISVEGKTDCTVASTIEGDLENNCAGFEAGIGPSNSKHPSCGVADVAIETHIKAIAGILILRIIATGR